MKTQNTQKNAFNAYLLVPDGPEAGHKSYYGKAIVIKTDSAFYLKSYGTTVCGISKTGGRVTKYVENYVLSRTTSRHLASFLYTYGPIGYTVKNFRALGKENAACPV